MCDALAALPLGVALEELAHLEKQHDEDGLSHLRLSIRQETDGERTDGGYRHQEMLVEPVAMHDAFGGLMKCLMTGNEIGDKIDEQ